MTRDRLNGCPRRRNNTSRCSCSDRCRTVTTVGGRSRGLVASWVAVRVTPTPSSAW
ncbi:hypothetical protein BJ971_005619 [Actinoplanes digitatis]|uniref:Uncharacterized protein n=1 Tax=Actinoplanes digitatis TaxID=1868 RepID=A0A7W7I2H2_9ACTN|nr:hypothetical protein [Actinoplanes digitatis]